MRLSKQKPVIFKINQILNGLRSAKQIYFHTLICYFFPFKRLTKWILANPSSKNSEYLGY